MTSRHDIQDRITRTGNKDRQVNGKKRTGKGQPRKDSQELTVGKGQLGQDSQERSAS
jgi:hypothetical protein